MQDESSIFDYSDVWEEESGCSLQHVRIIAPQSDDNNSNNHKPSREQLVVIATRTTQVVLEGTFLNDKRCFCFVHPFVCHALLRQQENRAALDNNFVDTATLHACSFSPLEQPFVGDDDEEESETIPVALHSCSAVKKLPTGSTLMLQIVEQFAQGNAYTLDVESLSWALEGSTFVAAHSSSLVFLSVHKTYVAVLVKLVNHHPTPSEEFAVYRIGMADEFRCTVLPPRRQQSLIHKGDIMPYKNSPIEMTGVPGYEESVHMILQLLLSPVVTTTGILLTGCAGVGKTFLARQCARLLASHVSVQWVSAADLLLSAAAAAHSSLIMQQICPRRSNNTKDNKTKRVVFMDDVSMLFDVKDEAKSTRPTDWELSLICKSWNEAMTECDNETHFVAIVREAVDISEPASRIIRRFEKEVHLEPPTMRQRKDILCHLLSSSEHLGMTNDNGTADKLSTVLATATAGCVAADLCNVLHNAFSAALAERSIPTSNHFLTAAHDCVPNQLALLDVIMPTSSSSFDSSRGWKTTHQSSWSPVSGYEDLKKQVYKIVVMPWRRFLSDDQQASLSSLKVHPPSGVLFHGPSGCGKTLAARCLCSSLELPVIAVHAADVLDKWVGGSEAAIRALFARARSVAPCVLFMDEIDAIASNRSMDSGSDFMSRILSTLLNEMDGVSTPRDAGVLVVACTNRLSMLDSALLRPGRLEEHIHIPLPSLDDAVAIYKAGLGTLEPSKDVEHVCTNFIETGLSGAKIKGIARDSVLELLRTASSREDNLPIVSRTT